MCGWRHLPDRCHAANQTQPAPTCPPPVPPPAPPATRDEIFARYDATFKDSHELGAVVHNAGQYVGITSTNADGLKGGKPVGFGDGSLLEDGATNLATMHYYQRMYGDAYVDLCERGLDRMGAESGGGSLIGISSPGCTTQYNANMGYDMPGAGKCVMEYSMRLFALRCAGKNINCNVVVPGVTTTDAWGKLAATRNMDKVSPTPHLAHSTHSAHFAQPAHPAHPAHPAPRTAHPYRPLPSTHPQPHPSPPTPHPTLLPLTLKDEMIAGIAGRISPMGAMSPKQLGDACAFLCSPAGRIITGVSLPVDGGVHLKA